MINWDLIAKIAFGIVIAYLLLKALGILQSPVLADIIAIISAGIFIGRYTLKIDGMADNIKDLRKFKDATINEVNQIKNNCLKNHPTN